VATARIARRLGTTTDRAARRLYATWRLLGIGERTGVDVAGESPGIADDPALKEWAPVDLANRAFGQSVGVTLIQLSRAFAAIANGGWLVTPHVALDGPAASVPRERVLDAETTRQLRDIMEHVTGAVPWYAEGSLIRGYVVGGKTGTAQIFDRVRGKYRDEIFNFSFVGYVGGRRPEAVIAVRIAEAKPDVQGQGELALEVTSYELFRKVARAAIRHLDIEPSSDPDAGYPIPLSEADQRLTPRRYEQHVREARQPRNSPASPSGAGHERSGWPDRADRGAGSALDTVASTEGGAERSGTSQPGVRHASSRATGTHRHTTDAPDAPDAPGG
jgi:membrane peptidoglycan carboxypeptidase